MIKAQERYELQHQYKGLQNDWESYKKSKPNPSHRRSSTDLKPCTPSILELMDNSPRKLMSSLQQCHSPSDGWIVRNNDFAITETARERQEARESGRLKGRRLFDALEDTAGIDLQGTEEICSICSSVLSQGREARSWSSYSSSAYSDVDDNGDSEDDDGGISFNVENKEREKVEVVEKGAVVIDGDNGGKWMIRMGWLALVLMVFALGIIFWKSSIDAEEDFDCLIPT